MKRFKRYLIFEADPTSHETMISRLYCGALSGCVACVACYPLDIVRTRIISSTDGRKHSISGTLRMIYRSEGIRGLYRGLDATLLTCVPNLAVSYATYGALKQVLLDKGILCDNNTGSNRPSSGGGNDQSDRNHMGVWGTLTCGSISGVAASLVTHPLDVLRRRLQLRGALVVQSNALSDSIALSAPVGQRYRSQLSTPRNSISHELRILLRSDGVTGLYRGLLPELLKVR